MYGEKPYMDLVIVFTVPPSLNLLWTADKRARTPVYNKWIKENPVANKFKLGIDYPIRVEMHLYKKNYKGDLDNRCVKSVLDQLTREGVILHDGPKIVQEIEMIFFKSDFDELEVHIKETQKV